MPNQTTPNFLSGHTYLGGATGSGCRAYMFSEMHHVLDAFLAGKAGMSSFDTIGDHAYHVLSYLQNRMDRDDPRFEKVHVIQLGETEYPVAMNFLKVLSAEALADFTLAAFNTKEPRSKKYLVHGLYALQEDKTTTRTLTDVPMFFRLNGLYHELLETSQSPIVKEFFSANKKSIQQDTREMLVVGNLVTDLFAGDLTLHVARPDFSPDIDTWIKEGHIVIFDASKLQARQKSFFLTCLLAIYRNSTQIGLPHCIVADGSHEIQSRVLSDLILKGQKSGFSVVLVDRNAFLLDEDLREVISHNQNRIIAFYQDPAGIQALTHMAPFQVNDIAGLSPRQAIRYESQSDTVSYLQAEIYLDAKHEWEPLSLSLQKCNGDNRGTVTADVKAYSESGVW